MRSRITPRSNSARAAKRWNTSLPPELVEAATAGLGSAGNGELMVLPIREAREHFERAYLQAQLERFSGNISRTASFVGMERSALHRKLKSLNIHTDD